MQKKTIARQLVDDVSATVEGDSERVAVTVTWVGGHRTETSIARPGAKLSRPSYYADLVARARALRGEGETLVQIAATLNAEGWRPAKRRDTSNASMVTSLLAGADDVSMRRVSRAVDEASRGEHERTLPALAHALAHALDTHAVTLHRLGAQGLGEGPQGVEREPRRAVAGVGRRGRAHAAARSWRRSANTLASRSDAATDPARNSCDHERRRIQSSDIVPAERHAESGSARSSASSSTT